MPNIAVISRRPQNKMTPWSTEEMKVLKEAAAKVGLAFQRIEHGGTAVILSTVPGNLSQRGFLAGDVINRFMIEAQQHGVTCYQVEAF